MVGKMFLFSFFAYANAWFQDPLKKSISILFIDNTGFVAIAHKKDSYQNKD
jgi:hypothetical protein